MSLSPIDPQQFMHSMKQIAKMNAPDYSLASSNKSKKGDFAQMLGEMVNHVNDAQKETEKNIDSYLQGGPVDIAEVMVSAAKSKIKLQAAVEVRNKFVDFYQQIMNMSV